MGKVKEQTLFLVFIAALLVWVGAQYINYYSQESTATVATNVSIGFATNSLVLQKNQPVSVDIFMKADAAVSGATVSVMYPPDLFEYRDPKDATTVSRGCSTMPGFKNFVAAKTDTEKGVVSVTRVTIAKTSELPKGNMCFGTITFVPRTDIPLPITGVFRLDSTVGTWQITGPQTIYTPSIIPDKSKLVVNIDGLCSLKPRGDANCDGFTDLADFEIWRTAFTTRNTYNEAADFDGDRKNNVKDFEIWRQGFFEQTISVTPTPECKPEPKPLCIEPDGPCAIPEPPPGGWCQPTPMPTCIPLPPCALPGANPQCALKIPPGGSYCRIPPTIPPSTATPPFQIQCNWCGNICTSATNLVSCPQITPPMGMTCVQIGSGCERVVTNDGTTTSTSSGSITSN